MLTKLIAIRHGETDWNVQQRMQGRQDIALNQRGLQQAELLAKYLQSKSIDVVYSSHLQRAMATANAIAKPHDLTVNAKTELREREFGDFEGHSFAQVQANWPQQAKKWQQRQPDFVPPGNDESLLVFQQRIMTAVNQILVAHPQQTIVIVAHGGVLDIIYRLAMNLPLQQIRDWQLANCAINYLKWDGTQLQIEKWNQLPHLQNTEFMPLCLH